MKNRIIAICVLLAGTLTLTGVTSVRAAEVTLDANDAVALDKIDVLTDIPIEETIVNQVFDAGEEINQLERISYSKGIKISGTNYRLYPEFENPDRAVSELEKMTQTAMDYLKNNYDLAALSNDNYEEYQACVCEALGEEEVWADKALEDELYLIEGFLDIYENGDDNREILEIVESVDGNFEGTTVAEAAQVTGELQLILPYNTGADEAVEAAAEEIAADVEQEYGVTFVKPNEAVQEELSSQDQPSEVYQLGLLNTANITPQAELLAYSGNSAFNVENGRSYANKYAPKDKHNTKYKYFDGADCTNFVSQIKKAGGVKEYTAWKTVGSDSTIDYEKSWFCKTKHNYSKVWTLADKFAKFFGIKSKTSSFYTLSTRVKKGSFIGYDRNGDGNWDHMAFVTAVTKTKKSVNGVTYYDFRIAQHSGDYHAYVSETINHWETLKTTHKKIVFAIIN